MTTDAPDAAGHATGQHVAGQRGPVPDLTGQVAVVTGAGGGIGRAVAGLLRRRGAQVLCVDIDDDAVAAAAAAIGADHAAGSVASGEDTRRIVALALERWGRLDVLVHSAGIGGGNARVVDLTEEAWRRTLEVNATGTFLMNKAVVPAMVESGYGRIVNVASIAGLEGNPGASHYSASKGAVIAFTKALGKELATTGVLVNAVAPAVIATDLLAQVTEEQLAYMLSKIPMGRPGTAEEAAELIGFLASPALSFSTGAVYDLSGGRATY